MMSEGDSKTILIVDDEKPIRDLLRNLSSFCGYNTLEAEDGQAGLAIYESRHPDLVISDVYMPQLNGLQLLQSIRKLDPGAPVILITGYSAYRQLISDGSSPPDDVLEKPFQVSALVSRIKSLLASREVVS